jgi:hypothetical protein
MILFEFRCISCFVLSTELNFYVIFGQERFTCTFDNENFSLYQNSKQVGFGFLFSYDNLYVVDIDASHSESLHVVTKKRKLTCENSVTLWHK